MRTQRCLLSIQLYLPSCSALQASALVPVERFESVCAELNAGLEREKQQQQELAKQRESVLRTKHKYGSVGFKVLQIQSYVSKLLIGDGSLLFVVSQGSCPQMLF